MLLNVGGISCGVPMSVSALREESAEQTLPLSLNSSSTEINNLRKSNCKMYSPAAYMGSIKSCSCYL